jgi:uncharacterized repeat protein (TIGR01451 family)
MASPTNTFAGMTQNLACGGCLPPDTDGDVGPNHYVQAVNSSIRVHDKAGNVLAGPITFNSFFSAMGTATPCGSNVNGGDGIVFYDHISDRWVVSDFAYPAFPGTSFYQCIGVSKGSDPISSGYWLYAVQIDPANTSFLGDYPKFGLWSDGYYMSVNLFSNTTTFNGVRVYALDRASMVNGGAANTIAFTIQPADLGDQYSLLPATYRTGTAPPAGQPEWFMDINSSAVAGTVETQVFVRRFHADFVTPANSFFGSGVTHAPDGIITVSGFVDAFTSAGTQIVPNGTATTTQFVDTLGDKLMYPLVYQNLGGVESIWSSHTVNNNQGGTGPSGVRWYQFDMTGNTIPATPAQQQTFNNGGDGLWRWMPSINVDNAGNVAIGYSTSSTTLDPGIRYAGRLATDPVNTMAQGEAIMTPGTGHQTNSNTSGGGRWGDYSSMFVDPSDTCTFYHTNEYYSATSAAAWNTRVGSFRFPTCVSAPIPTPTPTPTPTATPTPPPSGSAGPVTVTATAGAVGPTDYATLKAAFDAINAGTHQGTLNVYIIGNTVETAAAVLNASGSGSASYTSMQMTPVGTRTVSGNLATPLVDLNGADNVTIDGYNSGGNSLTLANSNTGTTAGTSTIRFINGAQNNTVKNCNIQGSSTVAVGTAGGAVLFSTSPAVGTTIVGNNNNTVSNNNIGPVGGALPVKAISAVGTTTNNNTINRDNVIDSNNIFDFFGGGGVSTTGIDIRTGNHNWTISNNRLYQTATRTFTTTALRYAGITLVGTTGANGNAHTIRNNVIGFGAANGTGTTTITGSSNEVRGLDLAAASSGTATSVQGNTISGINQTSSRASTTAASSPFIAISLGTTSGVFDVGNVTGNTIGSLDGSSTIVINATSTTASNAPIIGIYDFSLSSGNVSNNQLGAITIQSTGTTVGFRGILVNTSSASTEIINNNIIGGPTAAGAITDTQVGSYVMYGIQTALPAISMSGNTVRNMVGNSNFPATVVQSGYIVNVSSAATNSSLISRNTVHSLTNSSGAAQTSIYAMDITLPPTTNITANVVERNLVHSLVNTSTDNTSQIYGIVQRGSTIAGVPVTAVFKNNMVRLGLDSNGNSLTNGLQIIGIRDIQGATGGAGSTAVSYYFNSVYIGGTGVASSSNCFAFNSSAVTSTRNYVNNIFWNARSNASGAGKNYAISLAGAAPNPTGLTTNYNDLYATGTGGFVGLFNAVDQTTLANWQAAVGQDANSLSLNPLFVNANGTASTGDIHIQNGSPVLGMGIAVVGITNDFDGDARDTVPDIGADEIVAPTSIATTLTVSPATGSYGGTVNLSATLTDGVNGISGQTINFTLNGNSAGSGVTNGSGVATVSNASLAGINAGSYPTGVGASFAGNGVYLASNGSAALTVNKADTTTTVTVSNATYDGNPHGGTANVTGPAGLNQSLTVTYTGRNTTVYGPSTTAPTNAGDYTASASYAGDSNYNPSSDSKDYSIAKATPVITWSNPADIIYGTALSGTQLNATANVPGSFVYTPASGTVLGYGSHNLHVDFTPTDTTNYNNAQKDVSINVLSALFSMTKNVDRQAKVGYNHNYLIAITNNGNAAATSMTLSDPLPSQVRFTAVTTSQGTCSYDSGTHTVNCTLGTLGIGSTINIQITTKALQTGTLNNTATVSASQWDPATGGNQASVSHSSIAEVDLSVSKVDSADPIYVSQLTTYTMVVKNYNTPISATGVVMTDNLPASFQFVSATTSQGSLITPPVNSTGIVTANIGTLAVNATATITVTVRATSPGTITNTASASANENEANPANNSASQSTTVLTATLQKVLLAKQVLTGGCENTTGNVYLTGPAPSGGLTVSLASDISGASVPPSVFIPAGQTVSPAFNVTTSPVGAKQLGLITATLGVSSVSRNLTINVGSGTCPP